MVIGDILTQGTLNVYQYYNASVNNALNFEKSSCITCLICLILFPFGIILHYISLLSICIIIMKQTVSAKWLSTFVWNLLSVWLTYGSTYSQYTAKYLCKLWIFIYEKCIFKLKMKKNQNSWLTVAKCSYFIDKELMTLSLLY